MSGREVIIDNSNRAYVALQIRNYDKSNLKWIEFKYDPGADVTTISPHALLELGYDIDLVKSLMYPRGGGSTADREDSEWFAIDLSINHLLGQVIPKDLKFPFICMWKKYVKIPEFCKSGCKLTGDIYGGFGTLLGNNILSCFDITTDRANKKIVFNRLKDLSDRNKQYPDCEVHGLNFEARKRPLVIKESLSSDAKTILEVINKQGFIHKFGTYDGCFAHTLVTDYESAVKELLDAELVDRIPFGVLYTRKRQHDGN